MSSERLQASLGIDSAPASEVVRIIQHEDATVATAVAAAGPKIAAAIEAIVDRMRNGGRLFYAGAGTSGRIAMLDASELPPTFGVPSDLVQVIMAGGERAYFAAVEGAEDDEEAAVASVEALVRPEDALVGIAASGTTPFTVMAVRKANFGATLTIGVTSRPDSPLAREADIAIVTETGPEVIMGSSRMKAGTAQKLVLNALSTGVMIGLGKVYSNLMVEMPATNAKLRKRAAAMVALAAEVSEGEAGRALSESGGSVKEAIIIAARGVSHLEARELLEKAGGSLREVLQR